MPAPKDRTMTPSVPHTAGFRLDTSGTVVLIEEFAPGCDHVKSITWSDLDPFTQGYIGAAFASGVQSETGATTRIYGGTWAFSDLDPATLAAMIADCAAYLRFDAHETEPVIARREASRRAFWVRRQAGQYPDFSPVLLTLSDSGKVIQS